MVTNKVPDAFGRLPLRHGELMAAAEVVGQAARRALPLDERQLQLIQTRRRRGHSCRRCRAQPHAPGTRGRGQSGGNPPRVDRAG